MWSDRRGGSSPTRTSASSCATPTCRACRRSRRHSNAADGDELQEARDTQGRKVLTAHARVAPLRWLVFVELPVEEAYAPLYELIKRSGVLLFGALFLAALAGMFLARRMVVPIQALREGAERIGRGELNQRILVKTGDEIEALADQFNDMAGKLEESYAGLERKVEDRTQELTESLTAADRDRGRAQGHQPFHLRPAAGAGHAGRIRRRVCARPRPPSSSFATARCIALPRTTASRASSRISSGRIRSRPVAAPSPDASRSRPRSCTSRMSWKIRNTPGKRPRSGAACAPCSASRF